MKFLMKLNKRMGNSIQALSSTMSSEWYNSGRCGEFIVTGVRDALLFLQYAYNILDTVIVACNLINQGE